MSNDPLRHSRVTLFAALLLAGALPIACTDEDPHGDGHGTGEPAHAEHGPHGGHLLELGEHEAHLELLHDDAAGTLTIHMLAADAKTALGLAEAPKVKLMTADGPVTLDAEAVGGGGGDASQWRVTHAALKGADPKGRITVVHDGKTYNPEIDAH